MNIMREVEASLQRLQTDYIDLYQVHGWDSNTPLEETVRTLDDIVRQGEGPLHWRLAAPLPYDVARTKGKGFLYHKDLDRWGRSRSSGRPARESWRRNRHPALAQPFILSNR